MEMISGTYRKFTFTGTKALSFLHSHGSQSEQVGVPRSQCFLKGHQVNNRVNGEIGKIQISRTHLRVYFSKSEWAYASAF